MAEMLSKITIEENSTHTTHRGSLYYITRPIRATLMILQLLEVYIPAKN